MLALCPPRDDACVEADPLDAPSALACRKSCSDGCGDGTNTSETGIVGRDCSLPPYDPELLLLLDLLPREGSLPGFPVWFDRDDAPWSDWFDPDPDPDPAALDASMAELAAKEISRDA